MARRGRADGVRRVPGPGEPAVDSGHPAAVHDRGRTCVRPRRSRARHHALVRDQGVWRGRRRDRHAREPPKPYGAARLLVRAVGAWARADDAGVVGALSPWARAAPARAAGTRHVTLTTRLHSALPRKSASGAKDFFA